MADNTAITPGSGETIRDKDRAGVKTQIVGIDLGIGTATESLMAGAMPVTTYNPNPVFRASTFRTPGRAGTVGQKIFSLHNATGSTKVLRVRMLAIDVVATVIKAVTVLPPVIRLWKVTVLPTNGTALTKVSMDSAAAASNASVTVLGDASSDGTSSATALTATLPAGTVVTQEFAPRLITAAGYEMFDRTTFLEGEEEWVTLRALEGIVVFLDYVLATQNPTTDMWSVTCEWDEA
jgi:hypothetical protein